MSLTEQEQQELLQRSAEFLDTWLLKFFCWHCGDRGIQRGAGTK